MKLYKLWLSKSFARTDNEDFAREWNGRFSFWKRIILIFRRK